LKYCGATLKSFWGNNNGKNPHSLNFTSKDPDHHEFEGFRAFSGAGEFAYTTPH